MDTNLIQRNLRRASLSLSVRERCLPPTVPVCLPSWSEGAERGPDGAVRPFHLQALQWPLPPFPGQPSPKSQGCLSLSAAHVFWQVALKTVWEPPPQCCSYRGRMRKYATPGPDGRFCLQVTSSEAEGGGPVTWRGQFSWRPWHKRRCFRPSEVL